MNIYVIISLVLLIVILAVLIVFFINRKSIKIKILEDEAAKGNPETQLALGLMFYSGVQLPVNKEKGCEYIKKAAENGNAQAQYLYSGVVLGADSGKNPTKEQLLEAASWIQKAADGGFLAAVTTLANMYAEGKILQKDSKKAQHYFLKAAEIGDIQSQLTVAGIYHFSIGMDRTIGYAWYKVAEHNGNEYAAETSAKLYEEFSEEDKSAALRKADEYINKYADKKLN